jgi:hypothetical protein
VASVWKNGCYHTPINQTKGEATMPEDTSAALTGAIRVDEQQLRGHVDEAVRSSVEETLNALLDAEADQITGAQRYERSADRRDTRAGHYERKLETTAGDVTLRVPKLRRHARRLRLLSLPPYSRQVAPIERAWKLTRRLATRNRYFATLPDMLLAVDACLDRWLRPNRVLRRLPCIA